MRHLTEPDATISSAHLHNMYPVEWARLNREAVEEYLGQRKARGVVFFSRSASTSSPGVSTLFWCGDQMHTWDHLDGLESTVCKYVISNVNVRGYCSFYFRYTQHYLPASMEWH
jgi:alpha-glucosidase (family GH31 glycosyl hydrolase)